MFPSVVCCSWDVVAGVRQLIIDGSHFSRRVPHRPEVRPTGTESALLALAV